MPSRWIKPGLPKGPLGVWLDGDRMSAVGWVFLAAGILIIYYACFQWHDWEE